MRPKPLYGQPCNRCGACCVRELCPLGVLMFGDQRGPCPGLVGDGLGGFGCKLAQGPNLTEAAIEAARMTIGAGFGCDMLQTPADHAAARQERPRLVATLMAADAALSPEALEIVTRWRKTMAQRHG